MQGLSDNGNNSIKVQHYLDRGGIATDLIKFGIILYS